MTFINNNLPVRQAPTGGVEDPNAAAAAAAAAAAQASGYQPYGFDFDGSPPPDNGVLPGSAYAAGMPAPQFASLTPAEMNGLSADLLALGVTSNTEANTMADVFSMQDNFIRLMLSLRTQSLKDRDNEMVMVRDKKLLAIDKGLEAAKLELAAGITTGLGQIAAGVMTVRGGKAGEGLKDATVAMGTISGKGTVANGIASMAAAGLTYWAATVKADQQRTELDAEMASNRMNQSNERAANQREALMSFLQVQQQMTQTNVDNIKRIFA